MSDPPAGIIFIPFTEGGHSGRLALSSDAPLLVDHEQHEPARKRPKLNGDAPDAGEDVVVSRLTFDFWRVPEDANVQPKLEIPTGRSLYGRRLFPPDSPSRQTLRGCPAKVPGSHKQFKLDLEFDWTNVPSEHPLRTLAHLLQQYPRNDQTAGREAHAIWYELEVQQLALDRHYKFHAQTRVKTGIAWRTVLRPGWTSTLEAWTGSKNVSSVTSAPAEPIKRYRRKVHKGTRGDNWSVQAFHSVLHVPDPLAPAHANLQPALLSSNLYPFQRRAVAWLLEREQFHMQDDATLCPVPADRDALCPSFYAFTDADGNERFASQCLLGVMTEEQRQDWNAKPLRGGILAEEMGLGKTVELIALITLNRRRDQVGQILMDEFTGTKVTASPSTLIITPPSILDQWESEINNHAPSLKVYRYRGIVEESKRHTKGKAKNANVDDAVAQTLMQHDVVLSTYQDLARELWFAQDNPDKGLRHVKKYEQRRSPLVKLSWWRVCLDEAQMIESGVSNAAIVARQIPRINSWAVSGTPFKGNLKDLQGLLIFLRYEPFCNKNVWENLVDCHPEAFRQIFNALALRHTKASVRNELRLPNQKRIVINTPFAAIEEQHYSELFKAMCEEIGVNADGSPRDDQWDPESGRVQERMRHWLTRLRQTCLHPEVGGTNRRALGFRGEGPVRTLDQVLDVMMDQNETQLRSEERQLLMSKLMQGHLHSFGKQPKIALESYEGCLEMARVSLTECRELLKQAQQEREERAAQVRADADDISDDESDGIDSDDEDSTSKTSKKSKLNIALTRVRHALEMLHVCCFFTATAYYQVKTDPALTQEDSEQFHELEKKETAAYEEAKVIRRELLQDVSSRTTKLMSQIEQSKGKSFAVLPHVSQLEDAGGIESRKVLEQADQIRDFLNDQAKQVEEWRSTLVDSLLVRLLDQEGEVELTGEEYEQTTIRQDEQYAYMTALRALIADRNAMLTGQHNILVNHDMKEAARLAKEEQGPAPQLMRELLQKRSRLQVDETVSLRGLITDARSLATNVNWRAGSLQDRAGSRALAEAHILEQYIKSLQHMLTEQSKAITRMEKELDLFRSTQNARLSFYRQIQHLSDAVVPLQEEMSETLDVERLEREKEVEAKAQNRLESLMTRRRYLEHLKADAAGEIERLCIICQGPFENGVLTVCGHVYCKDCLSFWFSQVRSCPLCKRRLALRELHPVSYKPQELRAQEESNTTEVNGSPESANHHSIYTQVNQKTLDEIKSIELIGSYGTKIDTIARHVLWLRENDPGAKSIIFTQYADFLNVLKEAFKHFKIKFASIKDKNGISDFKNDSSCEAFMLHAKANSSGLNLVNATHVFLCEPLINAAIELQVIARVHRIGQRRPTTVWMYLVRDTVEEAIYNISVSRRLEHLQQVKKGGRSRSTTPSARVVEENTLDAANSKVLEGTNVLSLVAKGESGGEVVPTEDLWSCLFGNSRATVNGGSVELEREVGRHLRAEAAEERMNAESLA